MQNSPDPTALANKDFSDLLESISSMDERKRKLWMLIYMNAIDDRARALELYTDLRSIVMTKTTEYAIHGKTIANFVERMSRSNEQLLRLADLIESADDKSETPEDDVYDSISRKSA